MKTVSIELNNLGPIKHAVFDASHINVICGKNNSGKSFVLHTIYLYFSQWVWQLPVRVKPEHLRVLGEKSVVSFDVRTYIEGVNEYIQESMPSFLKELPSMLGKSGDGFSNTEISISANEEYLKSVALQGYWNHSIEPVKDISVCLKKKTGTYEASIEMMNKAATFPDSDVVANLFVRMLRIMFFRVLPIPTLMTAERVGTIMFGYDVSAKKMDGTVLPRHHYPVATMGEVRKLLEMGDSSVRNSWFFENDEDTKKVYELFCNTVAGGKYTKIGGKVYYEDDITGRRFTMNEVSTSVKSLLFLDDFLKREAWPGALLMIDEPETNLHPERQRAFIRLLAQMANRCGIGVAISTHSDIIIRELNTLIAFGNESERLSEVARRNGYATDEFVAVDNVACGIVSSGTIDQVDFRHMQGVVIPEFDHTIDEINRIQDSICAECGR